MTRTKSRQIMTKELKISTIPPIINVRNKRYLIQGVTQYEKTNETSLTTDKHGQAVFLYGRDDVSISRVKNCKLGLTGQIGH